MNVSFTYHVALIARCHYLWEASGFKSIPDIREVAEMDDAYIRDLMTFDELKAWKKTQLKRRGA